MTANVVGLSFAQNKILNVQQGNGISFLNIDHRTLNIEHRIWEPLSVGLGLIWAVVRSGFGEKFDGNKLGVERNPEMAETHTAHTSYKKTELLNNVLN